MASRLADFEFLGRLGAGSFGSVQKVRRKADGLLYVIKQISIGDLTPQEQRDSIKEVHIMASLDHPNVVRYYDSFIDDGTLCIVMEYCDRGDLQRMVKKLAGIPIPEDRIWIIFLQVCFGLAYLHSRRTLHRDLKSANIFMCARDIVKIGDLGVARVLGTETFFAKTCVGTPFYLSPELIEGKPYNEKSDVWAAGCVLYELCTGRHAFDAKNQGALILKIIQGSYPPIPDTYSDLLRGLVDSLLTRDSRRRPTLLSVLMHPDVAEVATAVGLDIGAHVEALLAAHARANRSIGGPDEGEGEEEGSEAGGEEEGEGDEGAEEGSAAFDEAVGLASNSSEGNDGAAFPLNPAHDAQGHDDNDATAGGRATYAGAASHVRDNDEDDGYAVRGAAADSMALALYEGMVERVEAQGVHEQQVETDEAGVAGARASRQTGAAAGGGAVAQRAGAAITTGVAAPRAGTAHHASGSSHARPAQRQGGGGGELPARRVRQVAGSGAGAVFGTATLAAPVRRVLPLPPSAQEAAAAAARRAQSADGSARGGKQGRGRGDSGSDAPPPPTAALAALSVSEPAAPSAASLASDSKLTALYAEQVAALPDEPLALASPTTAARPRTTSSRPSVSMLLSVAAGLAGPSAAELPVLPVVSQQPAAPVPAPASVPASGPESGASEYDDDDFESDDENVAAPGASVKPAVTSAVPSSVSEASGVGAGVTAAASDRSGPHHRIHLFGYPPLDGPAPEVEEEDTQAGAGGEEDDDDQQYTTLEDAKIIGELLRERQEVLVHYNALKRRFESVVAAAPLAAAASSSGPLSPGGFGGAATTSTLASSVTAASTDSLHLAGGAQLPPEAYLTMYRLGFYEGRLREIEDDLVELGLDPAAIRTPL